VTVLRQAGACTRAGAREKPRQGETGVQELPDLLFKDYNRLNEQKVKEIAQKLKLDMQQFEKDRKDPQITGLIRRDILEGNQAGVRGTPTIFVNGRLLRNRSPAGFQELIEKALKKPLQ
jgi:protein-disulfide isomerase